MMMMMHCILDFKRSRSQRQGSEFLLILTSYLNFYEGDINMRACQKIKAHIYLKKIALCVVRIYLMDLETWESYNVRKGILSIELEKTFKECFKK